MKTEELREDIRDLRRQYQSSWVYVVLLSAILFAVGVIWTKLDQIQLTARLNESKLNFIRQDIEVMKNASRNTSGVRGKDHHLPAATEGADGRDDKGTDQGDIEQ